MQEGNYRVPDGYVDHLKAVMECHQRENVMAGHTTFDLVAGDATETIGDYLDPNPETIIAFAYCDMQLYEPTKACLSAIRPYLTKGSVIAMDELNCRDFPGETVSLREEFGLDQIRLRRSQILPDRSYFVIE